MRLISTIAILVAQFSAMCWAQSPATAPAVVEPSISGVTLGPDTTVFTGPLLPDGSIDYVAAVNARESQGITPENNAACLLMRITLPDTNKPPDLERRAEILRLIGADNKAGLDVVWHKWNGFQHPLPTDNPDAPGYVDRFDSAKERPWSSDDMPELAAWLKSNAPALAIAEEALRRQRYWIPIVHQPSDQNVLSADVESSSSARLSALTEGFCVRCMLKLKQGDTSGALQDILTLEHLGRLAAQSPDAVTLLTGISMQMAACRASWRVLQDSRLPADQLRQWSASLVALGPIPTRPHEMWQRSRYEFLSAVQMLATSATGVLLKHMTPNEIRAAQSAMANTNVALPDWNRILRQGNAFFDDLDKHLSSLPENQRTTEEKAFDERFAKLSQISSDADRTDVGDTPKWLFPQNGETREAYSDRVGAIILILTGTAVHGVSDITRRCNSRVVWTASVGVALANYRNEHGEYPRSLDALIPIYLARLPDNTSPNPIGYELHEAGYIIRNVRVYPATVVERMAKRHLDYDLDDIIIRTDGR